MKTASPLSTKDAQSVNRTLFGIGLLSVGGAGASTYLTSHYFELKSGTAGFSSLCNISETMNCDLVTSSRFAELAFGLPLSSFALGFFLAALALVAFAFDPRYRREASRGLLHMGAFGTAVSLVYLAIMAVVLRTGCLFCLAVDAANAGILLLAAFGLKPARQAVADSESPARWKTLGIAAALALLFPPGASALLGDRALRDFPVGEVVTQVMATPPVAVGDGTEFPTLGSSQAPVTIVEFSDFQCPHCRHGAMIMDSVMKSHPGRVKVVFRNYPLDNTCNPSMKARGHLLACDLARAAWCANQQGKFEIFYEEAFENQDTMTAEAIPAMASEAGVDMVKFEECRKSDASWAAVRRDIEEGDRLGVNSTPTFFINGRRVSGALPPMVWGLLIDRLAAEELSSTPAPASESGL